ncbi:hypothetical protein ACQP3L_37180, partial [Escherichia coli]
SHGRCEVSLYALGPVGVPQKNMERSSIKNIEGKKIGRRAVECCLWILTATVTINTHKKNMELGEPRSSTWDKPAFSLS